MRENRTFRRQALWSWIRFVPAAVVLALGPAPAAGQTFTLTQITNTPGAGPFAGFNGSASINASGTRIAFSSDRNLTPGSPGNADANAEIFLFDTSTGLFTQITNTTGGSNELPSIDASGTRIAFSSDRDLTPGSPGNADGNVEIFLFDTSTGLFTQVTNTTGGSNQRPSLSAGGTRIAFSSNRDLTPGSPGNADGNVEIFLFDTSTGLFTQITNTTGATSGLPSISGNGTRIAFSSNANLTPIPGNADGNPEIFLFDTSTGLFTQVTNTSGGENGDPSISANGTRIAFTSNRDLTPGFPGNADGNTEIFLFEVSGGGFTQITSTLSLSSFAPSINADGTRIAFWSQADLTPGLPGNPLASPEIYLFDSSSGRFTQITDNPPSRSAVAPSINADGTRIAFQSNGDLTPGNPGNADGNTEIFLAIGPSAGPASIPTLSEGMQIILAALLLLAGLRVLRRTRRSASPGD